MVLWFAILGLRLVSVYLRGTWHGWFKYGNVKLYVLFFGQPSSAAEGYNWKEEDRRNVATVT